MAHNRRRNELSRELPIREASLAQLHKRVASRQQSANAYGDYALELSVLAKTDPLPALLERLRPVSWRRTYGRFHPRQASYCTLLYEPADNSWPVCIALYRDALNGDAPGRSIKVGALGTAVMTDPNADKALPTLPALLARHPDSVVVRWRPLQRCTFRWLDGTRQQYVKVLAQSDDARQIDALTSLLWRHRDEFDFVVAEPLGFDAEHHCVRQDALPGVPSKPELFGPNGLAVAAEMGGAAASLALSSVAANASASGLLARADGKASGLASIETINAFVPEYAARLNALAVHLERIEAGFSSKPQVAVHGGLHASQWLRVGDRLGLVDFDRLGLGDAEFDVATMVTELRYEKSTAVPAQALCNAFTAAYAERLPLDPRRLAWHCGHKELSKLMRVVRAPRPDAPLRFQKALERVERTVFAFD